MKVVKCLPVLLFVFFSVCAFAQNDQAVVANAASAKYGNLPVLPSCAQVAQGRGDPSKEAAVILAKVSAGCVIPWHWHTFSEQLMFVSGTAKVEMKDGQPATLTNGDYIYLPAKHQHQFTCQKACTFFIVTEGAFDIHYMQGDKEIPPEEALKGSMKKK